MNTAQGFCRIRAGVRRDFRIALLKRLPRCFCCFSMKLSATGNVCSAEILDFGHIVAAKTAALFRCFPLFLLLSIARGCASKLIR